MLMQRKWVRLVPIVVVVLILALGASIAFAQAPQPNPLPPDNPLNAHIAGLDMSANGLAVTIHGNPLAGRALFVQDCASCHGPQGTGGVANPGSDDGTVPPLNPLDPGFLEQANGDPAVFVKAVDLFVQHGSQPSGDAPKISMTGWGDRKLITQQQIADVEAYVMSLNGMYWPDRWAPPIEIQMQASRSGGTVTYQIMLLNQGAADLTNVVLRDTLPAGVSYVTSYLPGPGQNPGMWNGSTVEWVHSSVPQGGSLGPFVIVGQTTAATVPPNVAQAAFRWFGWDGTHYDATAVSDPVSPTAGAAAAQARPTTVAPGLVATQAAPAKAPAVATAAPTATEPESAVVTGDAVAGAQLFQTKGCSGCHVVNGQGGSVGPDLTHIATTPYDSMPNTVNYLEDWLANPPAVKPGTTMPKIPMTDTELDNLVAYLRSLK